jgi:hypothetical protein
MTVTDRKQTRPLVRESAPQGQHSNFQTENNIWSQVTEWIWHQDILTDWPSVVAWLWLWLNHVEDPCGGGIEYLHCSPASCKRWLLVGGVSRIWTIKYGLEFRGTVMVRTKGNLQTRNCLKKISWRKKNWSLVPVVCLTPRQTVRLSVGRNLTSTSTEWRQVRIPPS